MNNSKMYGKEFAEVYDQLMSQEYYAKWEEMIKRIVKDYNIAPGKAMDLACGTGTVSKMLLEIGFDVICVDISPEMINIAKDKLKDYAKKTEFINSNMAEFKYKNKAVSLVVCFYDSINYLIKVSDLDKVFKMVRDNLTRGGYFLFDVNTPEKMGILQKKPVQFFKLPNKEVIFKHSGKENQWKLNVQIISKDGKTCQEEHFERGYSQEEITLYAKRNGLLLVESIDEERMVGDKCYINRKYYLLRKA
jgi:ubiquinone/menaquinone biosynthesis C-methylase UbiE